MIFLLTWGLWDALYIHHPSSDNISVHLLALENRSQRSEWSIYISLGFDFFLGFRECCREARMMVCISCEKLSSFSPSPLGNCYGCQHFVMAVVTSLNSKKEDFLWET